MRYHLKERFMTVKDDFVVRNHRFTHQARIPSAEGGQDD
jgi:hypothetical protein